MKVYKIGRRKRAKEEKEMSTNAKSLAGVEREGERELQF